LVGEVKR